MKKIFILILLIFLLLLNSQPSIAQSEFSLIGVSPAIIEEILIPGTGKKSKVTIYNLTDLPLPIKTSIRRFSPNENISAEYDSIFDSSKIIKIDPSEFILKPKEKKELTIKITTPKDYEPGAHYSTIFFQPLISQELINSQSLNQTPQVGVHTFFIATGKIIEKLEIVNLKTSKFTQFGPDEFELQINNNGNVHEIPNGEIIVTNVFNHPVDTIKLPITTILPKSSKIIKLNPSKKYILGMYKIQFKGFYGSNREKLNSSFINIWVIPVSQLLLIFILLTLIVIYLTIKRDKLILIIKALLNKDD